MFNEIYPKIPQKNFYNPCVDNRRNRTIYHKIWREKKKKKKKKNKEKRETEEKK